MKLGVQASSQNFLASNSITSSDDIFDEIRRESSKIPLYASNFKREYLFIRGLNLYFKSFSKKLDLLNHGLFETKLCNDIIRYMKRFLKKQKRGEFNSLDKFVIPSYDNTVIRHIDFINDQVYLYKIRYDAICKDPFESDIDTDEYLVDGKPYPGFDLFYDVFKEVIDQIDLSSFNFNEYDDIDIYSDTDLDSDSGYFYID